MIQRRREGGEKERKMARDRKTGFNENAASLYLFSISEVPNSSQNKHKQR